MQAPSAHESPPWFLAAVAKPRRSHHTLSGDTRVHYVSWNAGDTHKPGLLFVHGFLGHAHWWDFIAPYFIDRFRVFAIDLSGMGESGHRTHYATDLFVQDIAAVLRDAAIAPATVVGHSFGGSRLLEACAAIPELIAHAIVLDSSFGRRTEERPPPRKFGKPPPPFPDQASAMARFRLAPAQDCAPWLLHYLARHSMRPVDGGWRWYFDPALRDFANQPQHQDPELLGRIRVRLDYVCGELSTVVSRGRARDITSAIPSARGPIVMPQAQHHLMLDHPLALVGVLRALLA